MAGGLEAFRFFFFGLFVSGTGLGSFTSTILVGLPSTRSSQLWDFPAPPAFISRAPSSMASLFAIRIEPCDAAFPKELRASVPWME